MRPSVFVGREAELTLVSDLAERARANAPQAALIEGEAGIGKSSVLAKLGASLADAKVLRASGAEDESHLVYGLVAQIVAAGRGVGGRASHLLASGLNDGIDPLSAGPELLGLLNTIGRGGELVVLLVDDLHWADTASARALLFVLRRLSADPVLVVVTSRPGELARHGEGWYRFISGDERATRLQLRPFGTEELASLSWALGAGELSPAGAASLLQHTGGNPLYCATLLRELGAGTLGDQKGWPRVPKGLSSIILVRMARMTVDDRALVTAAAVLGPRCPLALAVQLAGTADPMGALDQAVSVSLLGDMSLTPTSRNTARTSPRQVELGPDSGTQSVKQGPSCIESSRKRPSRLAKENRSAKRGGDSLSRRIPVRQSILRTECGLRHFGDRAEHPIGTVRRLCPIPYCVVQSWSSRSRVSVMPASQALPLSTASRTFSGESVQS